MINQDYMIEVACCSPRFLHDVIEAEAFPEHQERLETILRVFEQTGEMPPQDRLQSLFGLSIDAVHDWDIATAYQMLEEMNQERYYQEAAFVFTASRNKDEDFARLQKRLRRNYSSVNDSPLIITDHADLVMALKQVEENKNKFLCTGIKQLARVLNNDEIKAWMQGALAVILGLSGIGKSIFLTNFARDSMENGYSILYVSTEMGKLDILERISKSLYQAMDVREIILKSTKKFGRLAIHKVHPYEATYLDIQGIIDSLGWKPDIIYIDYADELKSHEKASSEYDAQGFIYTGLKTLAEINNVPVVTATQTNRTAADENGGTKKHVGYAAVADSSKKIRLADTLFSIVQTPEERAAGTINLAVIKNRKNTSGQNIEFDINYKMMRIEERVERSKVPVEEAEDMPVRRK